MFEQNQYRLSHPPTQIYGKTQQSLHLGQRHTMHRLCKFVCGNIKGSLFNSNLCVRTIKFIRRWLKVRTQNRIMRLVVHFALHIPDDTIEIALCENTPCEINVHCTASTVKSEDANRSHSTKRLNINDTTCWHQIPQNSGPSHNPFPQTTRNLKIARHTEIRRDVCRC